MSTYYVPGAVLSTGDAAVSELNKALMVKRRYNMSICGKCHEKIKQSKGRERETRWRVLF